MVAGLPILSPELIAHGKNESRDHPHNLIPKKAFWLGLSVRVVLELRVVTKSLFGWALNHGRRPGKSKFIVEKFNKSSNCTI
jgi:hypothetical protein